MRFAKKNTGTIVILWIGRNNIGNENLIWNWFGRSLTQKRCSYRRVGMGLHSSRNLGVHLTLFQPRGKIMPTSHITACPSDLKTYLHLCISNRKIHILFFQPRQTQLSWVYHLWIRHRVISWKTGAKSLDSFGWFVIFGKNDERVKRWLTFWHKQLYDAMRSTFASTLKMGR